MKETRGTLKDRSLHSRREYERHNVGNYPAEVKKPDGTKLNAFLNDISYGGLQIICTGLTAHMLSQKTGLLTEDERKEVEISIKIPFKEGIEKIIASCKLTYIAKNEDKAKEMSFAVGLQVENFKGESVQIIKRLMETNSMANKERRDESQFKIGRRVLEDRRKQNEEPHDPERRDEQERRTQADRRKSIS